MTEAAVIDETDLIKVRLTHLFRDLSTGKRRAMFAHGEKTAVTVSLSEDDVNLLIFCGCEAQSFEPHQYAFRFEKQPSVELLEKRGVYTLYSALNLQGTYITVEGRKQSMTQTKIEQSAPKKQEITLSYLSDSVNSLIAKRKADRVATRTELQVVITPEDEAREDAEIRNEVITHIDNAMDNYGKLQMANLWDYRQGGVFRSLPDSPETVTDVVRGMKNLKQRDYNLSLAMVIDRIFSDVEAAVKSGKPYVNTEDGNRSITVELLIVTPGLIQKLTKSSDAYERLLDRDSKQKLLVAILNESAEKVKSLRDGQQVVDGIQKVAIKITPIPGTSQSKIELIANDESQVLTIQKLLRPILDTVQQ